MLFFEPKSLIKRMFANVIDLGAWCGRISRFLHGGIPKRSKGSDCKSDGSAFEGSNPSPTTKFVSFYIYGPINMERRGRDSGRDVKRKRDWAGIVQR